MRSGLLGIAFITLTIACNGTAEYERELATVDSLRSEVQRYDLMLDSISVAEVKSELSEVNRRFEVLRSAPVPDTNKQYWVVEMGQLATLRKGLNRYAENHEDLEKAVEYAAHQLETLHNSLKDEKLNQSEAKEYLYDERRATEQLKFQVDKNYHSARQSMQIWELRREHYDSLVSVVK